MYQLWRTKLYISSTGPAAPLPNLHGTERPKYQCQGDQWIKIGRWSVAFSNADLKQSSGRGNVQNLSASVSWTNHHHQRAFIHGQKTKHNQRGSVYSPVYIPCPRSLRVRDKRGWCYQYLIPNTPHSRWPFAPRVETKNIFQRPDNLTGSHARSL